MNLKKQSGGLWVKASEEKDLPEENGIYIVRNKDNSIYEMYYDKASPTKFHYLNPGRQKTENVIYSWHFIVEWLKPFEQVYLLSEDELEEISVQFAGLFRNDAFWDLVKKDDQYAETNKTFYSTKELFQKFIQSITK